MPTESISSGAPLRSKTTTRTSIRHSLNLSSVGKALADVMNKESRDSEKEKTTKKMASRRLSALAAPRASMDSKSPAKASTPESKTITRSTRRSSVLRVAPTDEQGNKPPEPSSRLSTLRPRNTTTASSALPKYRPKSITADPVKKPPSPIRAGARKRLSSSEDEDKEDKMKVDSDVALTSSKKSSRAISPLPQRGALKVNLTSAINVIPSTPVSASKSCFRTPSPGKESPVRPSKAMKSASATSLGRSAIPRPPSSSSSSSSLAPRTPKTPTSLRNALGFGGSSCSRGSNRTSPLRNPAQSRPDSPLASRSTGKNSSPMLGTGASSTPTTSQFFENNSEDSMDADDVEMLLAPVASLAAPTPAIPRLQKVSRRLRNPLQTPTRTLNTLPTRANMSYLSPVPPSTENSPTLRPKQKVASNDRGSILSWEQIASESSRTLGEGDINSMLSDIPAPFLSGSNSRAPTPSPRSNNLEVPESPFLNGLPSPGEYGSISQVLLPDVTPSPAVYHHQTLIFDTAAQDVAAGDAAAATLLRLQLASAEHIAKDRLERLQALEEELHSAKQARVREAEDLAQQVSLLEERLQVDVEARERAEEERSSYIASLEDQVRHAEAFKQQAIEAALARNEVNARASQELAVQSAQQKWELRCAAREACASWKSVREQAEDELDLLRSSREMLSVLMAGLDPGQMQMREITA